MRKQDLYDFIETKLSRTKNGLYKQRDELLSSLKVAAESEFKGLESISRHLKIASDSMDKVREEHPEILRDYYYTNNKIGDCNRAIYFGSSVIGRLFEVAKTNLDHTETNRKMLTDKYPIMLKIVDSLRDEYEAINDKVRDVDTLEFELTGVIKGSRSAKDAYKNLVALNVNMSGFEDSQKTLPAVQKLSVNVCVINEDCGEGN